MCCRRWAHGGSDTLTDSCVKAVKFWRKIVSLVRPFWIFTDNKAESYGLTPHPLLFQNVSRLGPSSVKFPNFCGNKSLNVVFIFLSNWIVYLLYETTVWKAFWFLPAICAVNCLLFGFFHQHWERKNTIVTLGTSLSYNWAVHTWTILSQIGKSLWSSACCMETKKPPYLALISPLLSSPGSTCQDGTTGRHQSHGRHWGQWKLDVHLFKSSLSRFSLKFMPDCCTLNQSAGDSPVGITAEEESTNKWQLIKLETMQEMRLKYHIYVRFM